ncbi:hypothetical protein HLH44_18955 [Gluconacetobacter sp. 1c LMG 22058]|uniref:Uncharacterized protein n=1 Tax=Gluconacetobacter dulcium TaxID=2729096 RepID=A0A7W4K3H3_9PROT|nr:hypothetical protein [Gluconacetobacter dulcium]MBB2199487.1 hypothetical protein [Gluconacetobacter dulcium]
MDAFAYDKLLRITRATEAAAVAMGRAQNQGAVVALSQYNELADMYNSLVAEYNTLYHAREQQKAKLDEWITYGKITTARRDELKEIAQNSLRRETKIAEERDTWKERAVKASKDRDEMTAKYKKLWDDGKAWADMWKSRAEAAEKKLAEIVGASAQVDAGKQP